jgi:hypothetical protein
MMVVHLEAVRNKQRSEFRHCWHPEETAELMRLYAFLVERSNAEGYESGKTENREPQFYILGPAPTQNCIICVSRISKDGRTWYVIETGSGGLFSGGYSLRTLVTHMSGSWRSLRTKLLVLTSLFSDAFLIGEPLTEESFSLSLICWLGFA